MTSFRDDSFHGMLRSIVFFMDLDISIIEIAPRRSEPRINTAKLK